MSAATGIARDAAPRDDGLLDYVHRADLLSAEQKRALCERSDLRGALQLGSHVGAIGASGALLAATWGSAWAAPVFLLHGVLLNWLYAAQHEMMHNTAFRSRWANEAGSRLTGLLVLFPRDLDRIAHFRHHRFTADPARDPELADVPPDAGPPSRAALAWRLLGLPYWRRRLRYLFRLGVGDVRDVAFMTAAERRTVVREARAHLLVYGGVAAAAIALGTWAPVIFWLGPLAAARASHEMQNLVEHTGRPLVPDVLRNTRVIRAPAWLRWLGWNMQYHCHHHLYAAVPFHRLPALDRALRGRAALPEPVSYAQALRAIVRGE